MKKRQTTKKTAGKKPAVPAKLRGPLQELGLSFGAEQAYLKLIETGPRLIADIARESGQFRADTYRHIDELMRHNLVRQVLGGKRKYYEAASPESIFSILKAKEERIEDQVTDLLAVFDRQDKGYTLETFDGKRGVTAAFERLIEGAKKHAEMLRIESPRDYRLTKRYYPKSYWNPNGMPGRSRDLEITVITNPYTYATRRKKLNRSSKQVPEKFAPFTFDYTTFIIEDRVGFMDFELEKAFVVKDKRFAGFMRAIFWMLYERL